MSEFENNPINKKAKSLEAPPQFVGYSGVEVITGDNARIFVGNETGRVLSFTNEWGTREQAENILSSLRGYQYQPLTATGVHLSPAAELGDSITVNGVHSGIYVIDKDLAPNALSDVSAPEDEEINHEYPYEAKADRKYKREMADVRASISLNADSILAEVERATSAEGNLSSRIELTVSNIRAEVVSRSGGDNSSFGWSLTPDGFNLYSGGTNVMKVDKNGLDVRGKITATSGFIGNGSSGFTITANSIYNGVTGIDDTSHTGVYIGTNGIVCGQGNFKVTSSGAVTASNLSINGGSINIGNNFVVSSSGNVRANSMVLEGTLTVGGANITAANLRLGAERANGGYGTWNGTSYAWSQATTRNSSVIPDYFRAMNLYSLSGFYGEYGQFNEDLVVRGKSVLTAGDVVTNIKVGGYSPVWRVLTAVTAVSVTRAWNSTLSQYVVSNVTKTTQTVYYLGHY